MSKKEQSKKNTSSLNSTNQNGQETFENADVTLDEIKKLLPAKWTAHPAADNPKKSIITIIILISAGIASAWYMNSLWWGIFAVGILFLGLSRYFLPTEYSIDMAGIRERFLGHERVSSWRNFGRAKRAGKFILLSPYEKPSILDRFRGWNIYVPNKKIADLIVSLVKTANSKS